MNCALLYIRCRRKTGITLRIVAQDLYIINSVCDTQYKEMRIFVIEKPLIEEIKII